MAGFGWVKASSYLILVLGFTVITAKYPLYFTVRVGDDVTLPCENGIKDHVKSVNTTWLIAASGNTLTVFEDGKIHEDAKSRSDRLSVTEKCSLVIKKVTVEDVGVYTCRQFDQSGRQQGQDVSVTLSVVTMTKHQDDDEVTLNCSISGYEAKCGHTVKWVYQGQDVGKDNKDMKTSQSLCSASVSFNTSHYIYTSKNYEPLKCKVTDRESEKVKQFNFSPESSGEKTVQWWFIILAVALTALLIAAALALIRWRRNKGNKMDEILAEPEEGVSYASINLIQTTSSKVQIRATEDAVTYSVLQTPSSTARGLADPCDLYTTIREPNT